MIKSLATATAGMVTGTLLALSWNGSGDLNRIETRAQEFSNQATSKIESLKNEISSSNADKTTLMNEVNKLQQMVDDLKADNAKITSDNNTALENSNATSQTLGSELEKANNEIQKANEQTKATADKVDQILDLNKLK